MLKKNNNILLIFILVIISLSVISAFIIEYKLEHQPCKLCLYQRIPYFLAILLIIKIIFFKKYEKVILLILFLVFMSSAALAFYHFGIEQGFFKESLACTTTNLSENLTKEELLKRLDQNTIGCKNVSFRIFGVSLAAINTIFSVALSAIFTRIYINYGKN